MLLTALWSRTITLVRSEVKSGKTVSESYFANLKVWQKLTDSEQDGTVVYGGERTLQASSGKLVSWRELDKISE